MDAIPRYDKDCVFCTIVRAQEFVDDNRKVCWFAPLNPVVKGHMLFVPKVHVRDAATSPITTAHTVKAAAEWGNIRGGESFNLITSTGRPATQSIYHLHVHYIPRFGDDGLHLPWTGQVIPTIVKTAEPMRIGRHRV